MRKFKEEDFEQMLNEFVIIANEKTLEVLKIAKKHGYTLDQIIASLEKHIQTLKNKHPSFL